MFLTSNKGYHLELSIVSTTSLCPRSLSFRFSKLTGADDSFCLGLTSFAIIRGKAKRKIHARYPFLGGGTYQPPRAICFIFPGRVPASGHW